MRQLDDDEIEWIKGYADAVLEEFSERFKDGRFTNPRALLVRFEAAVQAVLGHKRSKRFRGVDEAHNELCVASAILSYPKTKCVRLEYEPAMAGCEQTIDFRALLEDGRTGLVEVKTVMPEARDRWEQFERANKEKWFPERVNVTLSEEEMGGELWHNMFASRARMLEYTLELEGKISSCRLAREAQFFVLAFCGSGFHWHESELEDFADFYQRRHHRMDDPFADAEDRYISESKITLDHTISGFACILRSHGMLDARHVNWNVRGPALFRGS